MLTTRLIDITFFSTNFLLAGFEPSISRSKSNAIPPSYHYWLIGMFVYYCRTLIHTHTDKLGANATVYLCCISSKSITDKYIRFQTNQNMTTALLKITFPILDFLPMPFLWMDLNPRSQNLSQMLYL